MNKGNFQILSLKGEALKPYLLDLANLRITVFKEYPYLYDGNIEYEMTYLTTYLETVDSVIFLILHDEKIIGASTALPLKHETKECQQPFIDQNLRVDDFFYFGESILLPAYRGQGIYPEFFKLREKAARDYGCHYATFAAIERNDNDPKRPNDYRPLDRLWTRFGYTKHKELCAYFKWKEIGEPSETKKSMIFWLKKL